ncbi:unnamed protein product [Tilletia controversa]|nr:unnamed protein product [Tilletia controversa]CAD6979668.1 unnamed protein product [Tilletia controversa]
MIKSEVIPEGSANPSDELVAVAPGAADTPVICFGSRSKPFFFLSNLFPSRISLGDFEFFNAEAAFQAAKFHEHPNLQQAIIQTQWPEDVLDKVQYWARYVLADWEEQRLAIMQEVQILKYSQNQQLRARLLQTGDAELIYTSADTYFGRDQDGQGQKHLGKILMSVRGLLRAVGEPTRLSKLIKLSTPRPTSRSTVWCANHSSERWYPLGKLRLRELTIKPAIEDAPASAIAFLHSIEHGDERWSLRLMIEVRGAPVTGKDGPWIEVYYATREKSTKGIHVREDISPEHLLESRMMGGEEISIYELTVDIFKAKNWISSISIVPSASAERPAEPDYKLTAKRDDQD